MLEVRESLLYIRISEARGKQKEGGRIKSLSIRLTILLLGAICVFCDCAVLQKADRLLLEEDALQEPTNPPIPYNFEYDSRDQNGTLLFRKESQDRTGKVEGRYGYKDMYGIERIVEYVADKDGYRAKIRTNEPGIERKNSAGVEFYADSSNQHAQIAKKQGENLAVAGYNTEVGTEEKKNFVAEKVDAEMATQYSGVLSRPSAPRSQNPLFPRKQNDILRLTQNAPLNFAQFVKSEEVSSTSTEKNKGHPQPLHYAQQLPTGGRQQLELLNAQVPALQYVSSKEQPHLIPAHRQLVAIPLNHLYIPQNQQPVAVQNEALSTTHQGQALPPQTFYSLAVHPQPQPATLVTAPLNYAQTPSKGTEYTPLGRRISGLSEYFQ